MLYSIDISINVEIHLCTKYLLDIQPEEAV